MDGRSRSAFVDRTGPLKGVFRLQKGDRHRVRPLHAAKALAGLASCSPFLNAEPTHYEQLMSSLEGIVGDVPAFTLTFRRDPGCLDLVEEVLG